MDSTTTQQPERLAVNVQQMAQMVPFSVRTLRRMDAAVKLPRGFKLGARKMWRTADLRLWAEWGFPERQEFEQRLKDQAAWRTTAAGALKG